MTPPSSAHCRPPRRPRRPAAPANPISCWSPSPSAPPIIRRCSTSWAYACSIAARRTGTRPVRARHQRRPEPSLPCGPTSPAASRRWAGAPRNSMRSRRRSSLTPRHLSALLQKGAYQEETGDLRNAARTYQNALACVAPGAEPPAAPARGARSCQGAGAEAIMAQLTTRTRGAARGGSRAPRRAPRSAASMRAWRP